VTFSCPKQPRLSASDVHLVGDFNGWDKTANPMRKRKRKFRSQPFSERGREYQFRYLLIERWENDWQADKYLREFGGDNSVVVV
jgi:1,4-alpha-glucan branching enzyme